MGISARRELLQTADASGNRLPVQRRCHRFSKGRLLIGKKCRIRQLSAPQPVHILPLVNPVQRQKLTLRCFIQQPIYIASKSLRKIFPPIRKRLHLQKHGILLRPFRWNHRKQPLHLTYQKTLSQCLSFQIHPRPGKHQKLRRLCHIQIQIKPLNVHLLPRRRCKLLPGSG